jgi:soluble lytic murein transglycosylase-like protein
MSGPNHNPSDPATVVSLTGDRLGYARALTAVESLRFRLPREALASTGGPLMSRIRSIVNPTPASPPTALSSTGWSLAAIGLVVALIAATSAIGESTHGRTPVWMPESVEHWSPLFEKASEDHGVDAALLSIVTLVESRGNPQVVSTFGAIGLMQIMPATAEKIATERGIDDFDVEKLLDPATNIDFGTWYFARQIEDFGDGTLSVETVTRAAAAYNGGPKRMRRHLDRGQPLSEESERYSRLVGQLWTEREQAESATLDRLIGGGF